MSPDLACLRYQTVSSRVSWDLSSNFSCNSRKQSAGSRGVWLEQKGEKKVRDCAPTPGQPLTAVEDFTGLVKVTDVAV